MNRYMAELVGTFVLVFASCGSAVLAGDKIGFLGVSLAFGLSLLAMVYAIGPVSGCHINPAVTVGILISKKMDARYAAGYIAAQIAGAILASALLLLIVKGAPGGYDPSVAGFAANGYGQHSPGHYNLLSAFLVEVVLTFFLVFTVLGATDIKAPVGFAGIAIGLGAHPHPPGGHPSDQHLGQPCAQHRAGRLRGGMGLEPALVIYSRPTYRRGYCGGGLHGNAQAGRGD